MKITFYSIEYAYKLSMLANMLCDIRKYSNIYIYINIVVYWYITYCNHIR